MWQLMINFFETHTHTPDGKWLHCQCVSLWVASMFSYMVLCKRYYVQEVTIAMGKENCWAGYVHGLNLVLLSFTGAVLKWATGAGSDITFWSLETSRTIGGKPRGTQLVKANGLVSISVPKSEPIRRTM